MKRAKPPLRLHVLSDLHIEHGGFVAPKVACDVVVVAGDLANGRRMTKALMDLCDQVRKPVIYVPGNHDWYQIDIASEQASLIQAWRVGAFNLKVLDDGIWSYEHHGTTYRFIGSTWWSAMDWTEDGATGEAAFERVRGAALCSLNDYGLIWKDDRPLTPDDSRAMHAVSTRFLQQQITEAQVASEVPIVVTHFLPSRSSCHEQYRGSLVNAYLELTSKLRSEYKNAVAIRESLDWEPVRFVHNLVTSEAYSAIGGPVQMLKIYKHANTLPINTISKCNDKFRKTLFGRCVLDYENNDLLTLNVDTMRFFPPWESEMAIKSAYHFEICSILSKMVSNMTAAIPDHAASSKR